MAGLIRRNREALEADLSGTGQRRYFSPVLFSLERALERRFRDHARGVTLDAGCGYRPYERLLQPLVDRYESLDVTKRFNDQTYQGDVQAMPEVDSGRYDTVVCLEVLEHVPRPADALAELRRVLKPGGKLILSVPFLSRLHEEPHDYYRYTVHGLRYLLETTRFSILSIDRFGSFFGFAGHQASTLLVGGSWHLPGARWVAFGLNALLVTLPSFAADRLFGSDRLPLGYVVVARSGGNGPNEAGESGTI